MNYKLAKIQGVINESVILMIDESAAIVCSIPKDSYNRDWQEYQAWLALGNEPEPADE